jgi:hypothetical protein
MHSFDVGRGCERARGLYTSATPFYIPLHACTTGTQRLAAQAINRSNHMATAKKRTLIEPKPGDKRFVRRNEQGEFKESDDVGRSLAADVKRPAKTVAARGQGDRGDRGDRKANGAAKAAAKKAPARKAAAKKASAKKASARKAPAKKAAAKKAPARNAAAKSR